MINHYAYLYAQLKKKLTNHDHHQIVCQKFFVNNAHNVKKVKSHKKTFTNSHMKHTPKLYQS